MNTTSARVIALALALAAAPALVEGALTNGGFDDNSGSLDGWTVVDGIGGATWGAEPSRGQISGPQAGTHFAIEFGEGAGAYIYQSFATVPSAVYELSFYAARPQTANSNFDVYADVFDGGGDPGGLGSDGDLLDVGILNGDVTSGGTWVPFTYQFTATSATSTLRFLDDGTASVDPAIDTVAITEVLNPPPVADFTASVTFGLAPLSVDFTDTSTGGPTSWAWDFGDTATSTDQNPSHTYTTAGSYTVTLTATNANGSDDEIKTNYIVVIEAPVNPGQVTNGGFDDNGGSLDGWAVVDGSVVDFAATWGAEASRGQISGPHEGTHFAIQSGNGAGAYIYQWLATNPGTTYELSFHAARPNTNNSNFALEVDVFDGFSDPGGIGSDGGLLDESVSNGDVTSGGIWMRFTYQFTAASAETTLRFLDPGTINVDPAVDSVVVAELTGPTLAISLSGGNLAFEWNSTSGMQYDLVSSEDLSTDVSTWTVYNDGVMTYEDIPASGTGTNTLSGVQMVGAKRFFAVVEEVAPPLLSENFEGAAIPAGWSAVINSGSGTDWGVDDPSGFTGTAGTAPSTGAGSSTYCAGTNVLDDYGDLADASLITPAITIPAGGATLSFQQWIDTDSATGGSDYGTIKVRDAGTNAELGTLNPANIEGIGTTWENAPSYSLAAYAGQTIKLEFLFTSNNDGSVFAGFYIDDVMVTAD